MRRGSGKGCTMLTLKGERCRNPRRYTPDPFHDPVTCRIHQHLEPPETYALAQRRFRDHLEREKQQKEMRRMVAKLPLLKVSVRTIL